MRTPENRLPIKAYEMLYALHSKNKKNWVSHVYFTLYQYGFGFVGENQGACVMWVALYVNLDRGWLIVFFKNGIVVWFQGIAWLCTHRSNKLSHFLADYLCNIKKAVLRRNLIKFRLVVFPLKAHRLRYASWIYRRIARKLYMPILQRRWWNRISSLYVPNIKRSEKTTCLKSSVIVHLRLKWQFY